MPCQYSYTRMCACVLNTWILAICVLFEQMKINIKEKLLQDEKHFCQSWKYASKDEANCSIDFLQLSKEDEEHLYDANGTDKELLIR